LVTRPFDISADGESGLVADFVLLNTAYEQMKKHSWAANDEKDQYQGFFRLRQVTSGEIAHLKSQWGIVWSFDSGACFVRPATSEEVAAKKQRDHERQGSALELKSDPMGVDFRPYLTQILATIRRNWFAVMPESVKLGQRGKVGLLFYVSRAGGVTRMVWAFQSGSDPLDRAAVAAIGASNPFPPLPAEYKGDRIVLQLNFAYNMPSSQPEKRL
jgi:TonB family protein